MLGKMKDRVDLAPELIMEILLRLPVKALLRFRSVCKLWLSIISNPSFATSHFQLAASPTHRLLFTEPNSDSVAPETLSIDFDASINDDSWFSSRYLEFLHLSYPEFRGSCRGFVFLNGHTRLYIWNPSTGLHKQIPTSPINNVSNHNLSKLLSGFGYDQSKDDYLVVLGFFDRSLTGSIYLMVFSMRANEWRQIEVGSHLPYTTNFVDRCDSPKGGLFLNGSIHFLVYNYETVKDVIIAFDLKERRMSEISLSDDFRINSFIYREYDLLVLDGHISAWMKDDHRVKIWMMREYGVHSSWTKIIEFSVDSVSRGFFPIYLTKCGDIIGTDSCYHLVKFNDKGQLLEDNFCHVCFSDRSESVVYTESLLSLPADIRPA